MQSDYREVLRLHRHGSLGDRIRMRGRFLLSDMDLIESHVPGSGEIVDLGCGHGIFSNLMALRGPERRILGIDVDADKIEHARSTVGARTNIEFTVGDVFDYGLPPCDAITIIDITYLIPRERQFRLLEVCRGALREGGILVWKTQETRPRWKYCFMYAQETAGSLAGMTLSRQKRFHYLDRDDALAGMVSAGFEPEVVEMPTRLPYCEVLYLGR